jgi:hypothetical protein
MASIRRFLVVPVWLAIAVTALVADDRSALTIPSAKVISLKLDNTTASQALAELTERTHIPVDERLGKPVETFSIDLPRTTFWQALDAIAKAAHGRVYLYPQDGRLALHRRSERDLDPPTSYSGLFRSTVRRVTASRDLDSGATSYSATLEVAWEPNLEPLLLESSPRGLVVRDDQGHTLPARVEGSVMIPVDDHIAVTIDVPLPSVPRSTARLGLIEGKLVAVAPSRMLTFDFDALDRLAELPADSPLRRQSQDDVTCRLTKIQLVADRWTIQVTLDYPRRGVQLESYQSRVVNNELVLEAKDGTKRLKPTGYDISMATDPKAAKGGVRAVISYHFLDSNKATRGRPAEWRIRYRTPAALVEVPLTFSFKDVPLP